MIVAIRDEILGAVAGLIASLVMDAATTAFRLASPLQIGAESAPSAPASPTR
ncbi:MAG: hypothetical protein ACRDG7_06220 [Candidatus Limnocylindria bacterium]